MDKYNSALNKFQCITLDGHRYYPKSAYDSIIGLRYPENALNFIRRFDLDKNDFIYARHINNKWNVSSGKSKKLDKLFIRKRRLQQILLQVSTRKSISASKKSLSLKRKVSKSNNLKTPKPSIPDHNFQVRPPLIKLRKADRFINSDDELINITMCGKRDVDKCYYRALDIQCCYNVIDIECLLIHPDSRYHYGRDFVYFLVNNVKEMYLKYFTVLSILFNSRHPSTNLFVNWCTSTLFTIHNGSKDDKIDLACDIGGFTIDQMKCVFKGTNSFPCVYLFSIGDKHFAKQHFNIDLGDDEFLYKYGKSENIYRRFTEHHSHYGKLNGCSLKLVYWHFVDPSGISSAESKLSCYFKERDLKIKIKGEKELVVIKNNQLLNVKNRFYEVGKMYLHDTPDHEKEVLLLTTSVRNEYEAEISDLKNELRLTRGKLDKSYEESTRIHHEYRDEINKLHEEISKLRELHKLDMLKQKKKINTLKSRIN